MNLGLRISTCLRCGYCPGKEAMANASAGTCPKGLFSGAAVMTVKPGGCCDHEPKLWGPPLWAEIHARPLLPLDAERERMFFRALPGRIPCCDCRGHYIRYAADNPIPVTDPDALREWCVRLHDSVNAKLGKPLFQP